MPRLIRLWHRGRPGLPPDRLTRDELRLVSASVRELSAGLTGSRQLAGRRYMNDPRLLGAYLLYFWPVSYAQVRYVLEDLQIDVGRVLDAGCGPLPATCALLDHGASSVTAADLNRSASSLGRLLLPDSVNVTFATWNAATSSPPPAGRYDTIVFSHVLNELWPERADRIALRAALLNRLVPSLRPGGRIIILEPALLGITRDLLGLRNEVAAAGWHIISPCFLQTACPALEIPNGTCHAAFRWKPPEPTGTIARLAGIDKTRPAMSYLVASPPDPREVFRTGESDGKPGPTRGVPDPYRVVSDPMRNKAGRDRLFVCGRAGRFAISAGPNDTGAAVGAFRSAERGDVVSFAGVTERGGGSALCDTSSFTILRKNGKAAGRQG